MRAFRTTGLLVAATPLLLALGALWLAHDRPLQFGVVRIDAWSAYMAVVATSALALEVLAGRAPRAWDAARLAVLGGVLFVSLTPAIVAAYAALALLQVASAQRPAQPARWHQRFGLAFGRLPPLLAAGCLALGYGTLAARGTLRYDAPTAGAALDWVVFWFTLLAAVVPQLPFTTSLAGPTQIGWRLAWLYPLVRLYSLGPWNTGWSYAALLLGGAAALWAALATLTTPDGPTRARLAGVSFAALTLTGFALGTSAGIAAGCYLALTSLLLDRTPATDATPATAWSLLDALPLTAPFVGVWMLIGAATAAGVPALGGVVWLVALLGALASAVYAPRRLPSRLHIGLSLALGIGAPLVVLLLITPMIEQLQGGLSVYGDVNVWPWVGLATINAAKTPVAALPSVAVAGLLGVLCALVYLITRLRDNPEQPAAPADAPPAQALLNWLRSEVPWLSAPERSTEGPRRDAE